MVLPFVWTLYRRLRVRPGFKGMATAVGAIYASYVFTVAEEVMMPDVLNAAQHACYAVAGLAAAYAVITMWRDYIPAQKSSGR